MKVLFAISLAACLAIASSCGTNPGPLPASIARPLQTPDGSEVNIVCPPSISGLLETADPGKVATAETQFNIKTAVPPEGLFPPGALTPAPNSLYSILPTPAQIGHIDCCQEETNESLGAPFGGGGVYGFGASKVQLDQMGRQCGILAQGSITFRIDLYLATPGAKEAYRREAKTVYADPSDALTQRTDFYYSGTTTESTFLQASGDRSKIGITVENISTGPVFLYSAATDSFSPEKDLGDYGYKGYISSDASGSQFLVGSGTGPTYVLDADLQLTGSISGTGFGVALKPGGGYGFRARSAGIDILDLTALAVLGTISAGDTIGGPHPASYPARMAISADGSLLAVVTDHGISVVPSPATPATPTASATPTPTTSVTPTATRRPGVGGIVKIPQGGHRR